MCGWVAAHACDSRLAHRCPHCNPAGDWVVLGLDSRSAGDGGGGGSLEDALLPVLNRRAHLLLDSFNKLRGPVAQPLNVTAVLAGGGDVEAGGTGTEAAAEEAPATKSQILIGHLASYSGMGRARVECVSGCTCDPSVLDGWWERHASLQVMHTIMVSGGDRCSFSGWGRCSWRGGGGWQADACRRLHSSGRALARVSSHAASLDLNPPHQNPPAGHGAPRVPREADCAGREQRQGQGGGAQGEAHGGAGAGGDVHRGAVQAGQAGSDWAIARPRPPPVPHSLCPSVTLLHCLSSCIRPSHGLYTVCWHWNAPGAGCCTFPTGSRFCQPASAAQHVAGLPCVGNRWPRYTLLLTCCSSSHVQLVSAALRHAQLCALRARFSRSRPCSSRWHAQLKRQVRSGSAVSHEPQTLLTSPRRAASTRRRPLLRSAAAGTLPALQHPMAIAPAGASSASRAGSASSSCVAGSAAAAAAASSSRPAPCTLACPSHAPASHPCPQPSQHGTPWCLKQNLDPCASTLCGRGTFCQVVVSITGAAG